MLPSECAPPLPLKAVSTTAGHCCWGVLQVHSLCWRRRDYGAAGTGSQHGVLLRSVICCEQGIPDFAVKELPAADELFTGEGTVGCMACRLARTSHCQLVLLAVMPGVEHHMPNSNNGSLRKQEASDL